MHSADWVENLFLKSFGCLVFISMKLFDAHCHLTDDALSKLEAHAAAAGVEGMACCFDFSNAWNPVAPGGLSFSNAWKKYPQVFPMIGMHPWHVPTIGPEAKRERSRRSDEAATGTGAAIHPWFVRCRAGAACPERGRRETQPETAITLLRQKASAWQADRGYSWKETFQPLEKMLRDFPSLGIGETGLDFSKKFTNRAEQEECFAAHLDLARELDRPVTVHCVKAWGRLIEILKEHPAPRIVLHAFGGSAELIPELMKLNCWFSFGEAVMNPKAKRARAAVVAVPADRLLIETDSCGEPEKLIDVARAVAELRGVPVEEIAELTFKNARTVFSSTD
jgi:TatD family hydrolase